MIIFLILFGLLAIVLEILVVPGVVVGILGLCSVIAGIVVAYLGVGTVAGNITFGATILLTIIVLIYSIRSRTWRKLMLQTQIDTKMNVFDESKVAVGTRGTTLSRLALSGKAVFNGEVIEVASAQELVEENQEVVIVKVEGSKVWVKKIE